MKNLLLFLYLSLSTLMLSACSNDGENEGDKSLNTAFYGKNLVTFGNSITAAENSWAYQVSRRLAFGHLHNGAVGGAIWSKRERTTTEGQRIVTQDYNDPNFAGISNSNTANPDANEYQKRINNCAIVHIQKYLSDNKTPVPDFIIISYGTNDLSDDATMGDAKAVLEQKDLANVNLFTMAGSVRWAIETLQTEYPNAKLYISLPLQAEKESKNQGNVKKIALIKEICDAMSVPYFDCYAECDITQANHERYLRDGLHPNEAGKAVHGTYIISKLTEANN